MWVLATDGGYEREWREEMIDVREEMQVGGGSGREGGCREVDVKRRGNRSTAEGIEMKNYNERMESAGK